MRYYFEYAEFEATELERKTTLNMSKEYAPFYVESWQKFDAKVLGRSMGTDTDTFVYHGCRYNIMH